MDEIDGPPLTPSEIRGVVSVGSDLICEGGDEVVVAEVDGCCTYPSPPAEVGEDEE